MSFSLINPSAATMSHIWNSWARCLFLPWRNSAFAKTVATSHPHKVKAFIHVTSSRILSKRFVAWLNGTPHQLQSVPCGRTNAPAIGGGLTQTLRTLLLHGISLPEEEEGPRTKDGCHGPILFVVLLGLPPVPQPALLREKVYYSTTGILHTRVPIVHSVHSIQIKLSRILVRILK